MMHDDGRSAPPRDDEDPGYWRSFEHSANGSYSDGPDWHGPGRGSTDFDDGVIDMRSRFGQRGRYQREQHGPETGTNALQGEADFVFNPEVTAPVKGLFGLGDIVALYGASSAGKTFVTVDMSVAIARGVPRWAGKRVRRYPVLYLPLEGGRGFENRVIAARDRSGGTEGFFAVVSIGGNLLLNKEAGAASAAEIARLWREHVATLGLPSSGGVIVVDTLAMAMSPDDENSAQDIGALVYKLKAIAQATGCAVVLIHHNGKDASKGMRGSSAIRSNVDTAIELNVAGEIKIDKCREGASGHVLATYKLQQADIGTDEDGELVTSCTVNIDPPIEKTAIDAQQRADECVTAFLSMLAWHNARHINVAETGGQNYAPTVFADHVLNTAKYSKAELKSAMQRLQVSKRIERETTGKPYRQRRRLIIVQNSGSGS
jgi:RecA-family ATPase